MESDSLSRLQLRRGDRGIGSCHLDRLSGGDSYYEMFPSLTLVYSGGCMGRVQRLGRKEQKGLYSIGPPVAQSFVIDI